MGEPGLACLGESGTELPQVPQIKHQQRIVVGIDLPVGEPFMLADEPLQGAMAGGVTEG